MDVMKTLFQFDPINLVGQIINGKITYDLKSPNETPPIDILCWEISIPSAALVNSVIRKKLGGSSDNKSTHYSIKLSNTFNLVLEPGKISRIGERCLVHISGLVIFGLEKNLILAPIHTMSIEEIMDKNSYERTWGINNNLFLIIYIFWTGNRGFKLYDSNYRQLAWCVENAFKIKYFSFDKIHLNDDGFFVPTNQWGKLSLNNSRFPICIFFEKFNEYFSLFKAEIVSTVYDNEKIKEIFSINRRENDVLNYK